MVTLAGLLVLGACGERGADPAGREQAEDTFSSNLEDVETYPIFISSEIVVGENRFLVALRDGETDAPVASPDIDVDISFFDLEESEDDPVAEVDTEFLWTSKPRSGVYVATPTFSRPGDWGAEVMVQGEGIEERVRGEFEVAEEPITPAIGDPAPPSNTPTAHGVDDIAQISSDEDPDPRFYERSISEALAAREPFVVVFATPKFCESQVCAPTLDTVKKVSRDFRDVTFIHSEIYEDLEPTNPPVEAVTQWRLPGEPWVFVVDAQGRVAAKYEGVAGEAELRSTLRSL